MRGNNFVESSTDLGPDAVGGARPLRTAQHARHGRARPPPYPEHTRPL